MPSPFPGMDPYIEASRIWSDFHADLATEIRASLNAQIQPSYYATAVTYVTYDVIEVAHLEVSLRLANVEVREAGTDMLVTAIEILSPVNKRSGPERQRYLRKRQELLRSEVHLMEIDLLRTGERSPLETPLPPAPYYIMLSRTEQRPDVDVWSSQLDERLPVVPVPLTVPDPDVPLDVGAMVSAVYERGAYATRIDYRLPVPPPNLSCEQAAWVRQRLAAYRGGRRAGGKSRLGEDCL
ncbi:MAG: hypothetical protein ETSY1_09605 [Candidatus Entotheonella factor]|uniref:DUF4058 domain-containing protein n=1 Tax=Entotheonella factor TaxID=1429438 RepID=W4LSR2_ENTF1|nr:DUF4058 family protein [Candidatus Entotheonella palauensis]ETX00895.1 MAG: hypothetical protein ETSY1_09605 [Candidatus Entotheonella factor]